MSEAPHRPSLRITGMHIERLKAIESLTLPEDGLGWGGEIPPVVMVGGMNGSGKTTLFEFIASVFIALSDRQDRLSRRRAKYQAQAWVDIEFKSRTDERKIRFIQGSEQFCYTHDRASSLVYISTQTGYEILNAHVAEVLWRDISPAMQSVWPGVVYLPSDERDLKIPDEVYKAPGKLPYSQEFVYRWAPPEQWKGSLEALLYSLRWEDLNAKAEGKDRADAFDAYAEEYRLLTDGANRLSWHNAELVVEAGGERHSLDELSSGEKQILLILAELRRHWQPGSLVLIDEPELHLHDVLQARLYDRLLALQRERGGQVWLATQSGYLFEVAEPNTRVILKRKSAL